MENNQTKPKSLNKSQTWAQVEELIVTHKLSKKAAEALALLLAPKAGGGTSQHPPVLDKDGKIIETWCKYHECYEPIDNMVVSNDKPKGYCKAAASKSNKLRKESKDLDSKVIVLMSESKFEEAQKVAMEAKALSTKLNHPSLYNLKEDWEAFNAKPGVKEDWEAFNAKPGVKEETK